jgi:hypothetical protein
MAVMEPELSPYTKRWGSNWSTQSFSFGSYWARFEGLPPNEKFPPTIFGKKQGSGNV